MAQQLVGKDGVGNETIQIDVHFIVFCELRLGSSKCAAQLWFWEERSLPNNIHFRAAVVTSIRFAKVRTTRHVVPDGKKR
jgi:hypothetical protein